MALDLVFAVMVLERGSGGFDKGLASAILDIQEKDIGCISIHVSLVREYLYCRIIPFLS